MKIVFISSWQRGSQLYLVLDNRYAALSTGETHHLVALSRSIDRVYRSRSSTKLHQHEKDLRAFRPAAGCLRGKLSGNHHSY
jgi:hypothetical protein